MSTSKRADILVLGVGVDELEQQRKAIRAKLTEAGVGEWDPMMGGVALLDYMSDLIYHNRTVKLYDVVTKEETE